MSVLVSICIPAYRQPQLLERCLQSVMDQTYTNLEIILSDDTPDEGVKIVIDKFSGKLPARYYKNSPSLGTPANWNKALDHAHGELTLLLHHDDWLVSPQSIERYVQAFNDPSITAAFGRSITVDIAGKPSYQVVDIDEIHKDPFSLLLANKIGPPSNLMVRTNKNLRYDERYKWLVDIEYYIRLLSSGHRFAFIDEELIGIGLHEGQVTRDVKQNARVELKENILFFNEVMKGFTSDIRYYDHFWRLFRNLGYRELHQHANTGFILPVLSPPLQQLWKWQSHWSMKFLRIGPVSKLLMFLGYLGRKGKL